MKSATRKKQQERVTGSQWNSLPDALKEKQLDWIAWSWMNNPKGQYHASMSIGVMIEFLYQYETVTIESEPRESPQQGWMVNKTYSAVELCDALWEAVKSVLLKI